MVETALRGIDAFNRRDLETLESLAAPDFELLSLRAAIEGTVYRGSDAFAQGFVDFDEDWKELHIEPGEARASGEAAIVVGTLSGRGRASAAPVAMEIALALRFHGSRLSRLHVRTDVAQAVRAFEEAQ